MHTGNRTEQTSSLDAAYEAKARNWVVWTQDRVSLMKLLLSACLLELCWLYLWLAHPLSVRPWVFQVLIALAFFCYGWAVVQSFRLAHLNQRVQAILVLGGTLMFHLTLLPAAYAFSDDIFRYVWDGRVSASGIDPYRYAPDDPALAPLRDENIWWSINAKHQPSPYPPLLEAWFALVYRLRPNSLLAMKVAMIALHMSAIGLILVLLHFRHQPLIRAVLYAWSPQVIFQVAFSGHNEPIMVCALLAGLCMSHGRRSGKRLVGAFALALATLAKLVPVLVLPVLVRRWGWRAAGAYLATVGAVYAALLLRGQRVFDGVVFEANTAQFNNGIHYVFYRLAKLIIPAHATLIAGGLVVIGLCVVVLLLCLQRGDDLVTPVGIIMAAYVLLAASVAPWYTLWVLPFVALGALPQIGRLHQGWTQIAGSFWLMFSWTAMFSELFYTVSQPAWRFVHILEYVIPLASWLSVWAWSRGQKQPLTGTENQPLITSHRQPATD